jgi:hypothetical protein
MDFMKEKAETFVEEKKESIQISWWLVSPSLRAGLSSFARMNSIP